MDRLILDGKTCLRAEGPKYYSPGQSESASNALGKKSKTTSPCMGETGPFAL
jgi:hypothetical protein